jgi:hypothetical protein
MADSSPPPKTATRAKLEASLAVRKTLSRYYTFILGVEQTKHIDSVPMDQLIDQAIRQIGQPPSVKLSGALSTLDRPPTGVSPKWDRLSALQKEFQGVLRELRKQDDHAQDPEFQRDEAGDSLGGVPGAPGPARAR